MILNNTGTGNELFIARSGAPWETEENFDQHIVCLLWRGSLGAQTSTDFDGVDITDVGRGLGIKMGRLATVCEDGMRIPVGAETQVCF